MVDPVRWQCLPQLFMLTSVVVVVLSKEKGSPFERCSLTDPH